MFKADEMGSPHYNLRWNNHQNHLLTAFDSLLQNETLVDVTLICEESSFKAHKVVLSACRSVCYNLLNGKISKIV